MNKNKNKYTSDDVKLIDNSQETDGRGNPLSRTLCAAGRHFEGYLDEIDLLKVLNEEQRAFSYSIDITDCVCDTDISEPRNS